MGVRCIKQRPNLHQIFEIIVLLLSYSAIGDRKEGSTVHVVGFNTCFIGWLI